MLTTMNKSTILALFLLSVSGGAVPPPPPGRRPTVSFSKRVLLAVFANMCHTSNVGIGDPRGGPPRSAHCWCLPLGQSRFGLWWFRLDCTKWLFAIPKKNFLSPRRRRGTRVQRLLFLCCRLKFVFFYCHFLSMPVTEAISS